MAVAQQDAPWAAWITDRSLGGLLAFVALSLLARGLRWWRGRSFLWRPQHRREYEGFGRQAYWAVFSVLLGLATPSVISGGSGDIFGLVAVGLFALGTLVAGLNVWRRRATEPTWPPKINPYPLLSPYTEEFAAVYFGREAEVRAITRRARESETVEERFIAVVGASGTGKSSLVRAGVVPVLRRWEFWPPSMWRRPRLLAPFVVGADPFRSLARAVAGTDGPAAELATAIRTAGHAAVAAVAANDRPSGSPELRKSLKRARRGAPRLVIILDQLEDLTSSPEDRAPFLLLLMITLAEDPRLVVVGTVRPDLLGALVDGPAGALFSHQVMVEPMGPVDLAAVVEGPARRAGVRLGDKVLPTILADSAGADALPLLSYLLHHLWHNAAGDGLITLAEYQAETAGGDNAIARHAEDAVAATGSRTDVLDALLQLVNHNGADAYRRRVRLSELTADQRAVISHFASDGVRLVTIADVGTRPVAEFSHEAVLRRWPALADHVAAHADELRIRTQIEPAAQAWRDNNRRPDRLLSGAGLREAEGYPMLEHGIVGEYLAASLAADTDEAERRANLAAEQALRAVDPPRVARDVDLAMAIAQAALTELRPTVRAGFGLYRAWIEGNRGVLVGHTDRVTAVAWSPDGACLATASADRTARIWSANGGPRHLLRGHSGGVVAVAWSPHGTRLATASGDGTARIWSDEGDLLWQLTGHTDAVVAVVWSPDGTRLATASDDRTARIWSPEGQLQNELTGHTDAVVAVVWSPDGTRLATASDDRTARIWSDDGKLLDELAGHTDGVVAVAWSPDGSRLATAGDWSARVWSPEGRRLPRPPEHNGGLAAIAWSRDGALATASEDRTARVWSAEGTVVPLTGHTGRVMAVAWSSDGTRLATGADDGATRLWSADGALLHELTGHTDRVWMVAWSPDSLRLATASSDGTARLWSADGAVLHELTGHTDRLWMAAWSPDSHQLATASSDGTARLWSADGAVLHELTGHIDRLWMVAWSPDGTRLATASDDGTARLWSAGGAMLHELTGHSGAVTAVAWSPDGQLLATASDDRTACVWSAGGARRHILAGHGGAVTTLAWSKDGRLATASGDGTARVWSGTGDRECMLAGHQGAVVEVAWSPDGARLATASDDGTARVWSADGGGLLHELTGHHGAVLTVVWSPDGARLATASDDRSARVWSADGRLLHELTGHTDRVWMVAWSPDGARLATASDDRTARVWSADGRLLHELTGHTDRVWIVAWSPDGTRLVTASYDRTARIWPDPPLIGDLVDLVATVPGLPALTIEQRRQASLTVNVGP